MNWKWSSLKNQIKFLLKQKKNILFINKSLLTNFKNNENDDDDEE